MDRKWQWIFELCQYRVVFVKYYSPSNLDELAPVFYMCHVPNGVNIKPPTTFFFNSKMDFILVSKTWVLQYGLSPKLLFLNPRPLRRSYAVIHFFVFLNNKIIIFQNPGKKLFCRKVQSNVIKIEQIHWTFEIKNESTIKVFHRKNDIL